MYSVKFLLVFLFYIYLYIIYTQGFLSEVLLRWFTYLVSRFIFLVRLVHELAAVDCLYLCANELGSSHFVR